MIPEAEDGGRERDRAGNMIAGVDFGDRYALIRLLDDASGEVAERTPFPRLERRRRVISRRRGGRDIRVRLVALSVEQTLGFNLSTGQAQDGPISRKPLNDLGIGNLQIPLVMDRAYECNETR